MVLSDYEQSLVQFYIEHYGSKVGEYHRLKAPVEHILRRWKAAKSRYLYKLLGDQLIYTTKVKYEKSMSLIERGMREVKNKNSDFVKAYLHLIDELLENPNWRYDFRNLMCSEWFLSHNRCDIDGFDFPMPFGKTYRVNRETKVTRFLAALTKAYNLPGWEQFRIDHSMCLNDKFLTGTLCLSIHPLDYMTMSDNAHDWSSCMSWSDHIGEYRQGTVEMMNSDCVIVAYLKSDNSNFTIDDDAFSWTDKKWRELFIITDEVIAGIKGYPYWTDETEDMVFKELRVLASKNLGWEYDDKIYQTDFDSGHLYDHKDDEHRKVQLDFETEFMYNDFNDRHRFTLGKDVPDESWIVINYSGEPQCMLCGEELYFDDNDDDEGREDTLLCYHCEPLVKCECCGDYTRNYTFADGIPLCESCTDDYTTSACVDDPDNTHYLEYCHKYCLMSRTKNLIYYNYDILFYDLEKAIDIFGDLSIYSCRHNWEWYNAINIEDISDENLVKYFGSSRKEIESNRGLTLTDNPTLTNFSYYL